MILAANLPLPKYLLAPEVAVLLQYFGDLHQQLIIDTFRTWAVGSTKCWPSRLRIFTWTVSRLFWC
jgi:hypothetical protein